MTEAGLVLEGGATRGVFTSGALDYLMEKDYDKLMAFYDHGYEMMKRELPRLEAYLEK